MNGYWLIDLGSAPAGKAARVAAWESLTGPMPGRRERPHQIGHVRVSSDGRWLLAQADLTDGERSQLEALAYVTFLGIYEEETGRPSLPVFAELAAHPERWGPM